MQRIKTFETDNTTNNVISSLDIGSILIPGFSNVTSDDAPVGKIIECTTLSMFKKYFGSSPAPFRENSNRYPCSNEPVYFATAATKAEMLSTYKATGDESAAKAYSAESTYSKGDYCTYNSALYKANTAVTTETFTSDHWDLVIESGNVVKVTADESLDSRTTYYTYTVGTTGLGNFLLKIKTTGIGFPTVAIPVTDADIDPTDVSMYVNAYDPSWTMAYMLLSLGMPVSYVRMNTSIDSTADDYDVSPADAYDFMNNTLFDDTNEFNQILDRDLNIRFITSGGYPVLEYGTAAQTNIIAKKMINLATATNSAVSAGNLTGRGDCTVILDHTDNPYRKLVGKTSVFEGADIPESNYSTVFTPWCTTDITNLPDIPGSFVYLYTLANSGANANSWQTLAGVSRGRCNIITGLHTKEVLTNKIAEYYQNDFTDSSASFTHCSINPITLIRNYGYCIWGDRTCEKYKAGESGFSLSFLHIRNMVNEIKKHAYSVSQQLMFETNDDLLWTKFKLKMGTLMDKLVANGCISNYTYSKNDSENTDKVLLNATITIYPNYSLEKVNLTIDLEDSGSVEISES